MCFTTVGCPTISAGDIHQTASVEEAPARLTLGEPGVPRSVRVDETHPPVLIKAEVQSGYIWLVLI